MEELIKRLERVIQTGAPDKDGMHPISAETVLEVVRGLSEHGTNLAEVGTDCISRKQAIDIAKDLTITVEGYEMHNQAVMNYCADIMQLPPIQPKRGRWIHDGSKWKNRWICSECGYKWFFECIEGAYCPNCGAEMEVTT